MRALLLVAAATLLPACFKIDEPPCAFSCSDTGACPDNYTCASDGYCHRKDYAGVCPYPEEADLSAAADLSTAD